MGKKREDGRTIIDSVYLGFGSSMQGPVFARKDTIIKPERNEVSRFNLKGICLKSEPEATIVGQGVIPHFSMTTKVNLNAAKNLVHGTPLEDICKRSSSIKRFFDDTAQFIRDLTAGNALVPYMREKPHSGPEAGPGTDLSGMLEYNQRPEGNGNRRLSEVTCSASLLTRDTGYGPSGFSYTVPYTQALEYPGELLLMLKEFALKHPRDLLPLRTLLLACHLWVDVMDHHEMRMERFMETRKRNSKLFQSVPEVPLAAFLIYYQHWLKWTEWMGLAKYPHPFRFVQRALETDLHNEGMGVDMESIDQERVSVLMNQATTRVSFLDARERVKILPSAMPGTRMPPLFSPDILRYPNRIQMALTGLVNLSHYGLHFYTRPKRPQDNRHFRVQAMDRSSRYAIIRQSKHINSALSTSPGRPLPTRQDSSHGVFAVLKDVFPQWKANTARNITMPPTAAMNIGISALDYNLEDWLPPHVLSRITQMHRTHYEKLVEMGYVSVNGDNEMRVGHNLLWTPKEMKPLGPEDFRKAPPKVIYGPMAARRSVTPSEWDFDSASVASPPPEPTFDYPNYNGLLAAWSRVPARAHWAWKEGLEQLKSLAEGNRPEMELRKLVTAAIDAEERDYEILNQRLWAMLEMTPLSDNDLFTVLPMAFGRWLGFPPPTVYVSDLWEEYFIPLGVEQNVPAVFYVSTILNHLRNAKYSPTAIAMLKPEVQTYFDSLKEAIRKAVPDNWFGRWKEFVVQGNVWIID